MPHCIVEISKDLYQQTEVSKTLHKLNMKLLETNLFDPGSIKLRAVCISEYLNGGELLSFIHATLKILKGRTDEAKKSLSTNLLETLSHLYPALNYITVEIIELEPNSYSIQSCQSSTNINIYSQQKAL